MAQRLMLTEAIRQLQAYLAQYGDMPVVLEDPDTSWCGDVVLEYREDWEDIPHAIVIEAPEMYNPPDT